MPKCLNSRETDTAGMVEIDVSKDVSLLENTVRRLACELNIELKDVSENAYLLALAGSNNIAVRYHHDFDGYECFAAEKGVASVRIARVAGKYLFNIENYSEKLLEMARRPAENPIERRMDLQVLLMELQKKIAPGKICSRPVVALTEPELNLFTAETILRYLS